MEKVLTVQHTSNVMEDSQRDVVGLNAADLFSVEGKVALVTGGSKGIGRMIAAGLVANGAKVYICSRKRELCQRVARELSASYPKRGSAISLPGDLSTLQGVLDVMKELEAKEGHLDILVNNAGATWGAPLDEYPDEAWQKVMDLNVRHLFNLTQKCLPLLKRGARFGDPSRVVNIASVDGIRATQTFGQVAAFAYTASKAAVVHLTKALSRALAEFQITCNCIAPGVFPSNMTKFSLSSDSGREIMSSANPLKRVGRTADMAGTVLYLCSPAGAYTNGATIVVDGGQHLFGAELFSKKRTTSQT